MKTQEPESARPRRWAVLAELPNGETIISPGRYETKSGAELCAMICVERYKRKFSVVEVAGPDEHIGASEQEPSQAVREQRMVGRHNCDLEIRRSGLWLRGQEGDVWTCSCGKRYEKCEDEAEGGCWMLLPPNARMSDGL